MLYSLHLKDFARTAWCTPDWLIVYLAAYGLLQVARLFKVAGSFTPWVGDGLKLLGWVLKGLERPAVASYLQEVGKNVLCVVFLAHECNEIYKI